MPTPVEGRGLPESRDVTFFPNSWLVIGAPAQSTEMPQGPGLGRPFTNPLASLHPPTELAATFANALGRHQVPSVCTQAVSGMTSSYPTSRRVLGCPLLGRPRPLPPPPAINGQVLLEPDAEK